MRPALVAAVLLATVPTATATASPLNASARASESRLAWFAGTWIGHTRYMMISRKGVAKESVGDGCCHPIFKAHYRLSNPRGSARNATVTATVTWVKIEDPAEFTDDFPRPRVGDRTTFRLRKGVLTERARRIIYCDEHTNVCGA